MYLPSPWGWFDGALAIDAARPHSTNHPDLAWHGDEHPIPLVFLPRPPDGAIHADPSTDDVLMPMVRNGAAGAKRPRRRHPGVEFAVNDANRTEHVFKTFDEAASFAVGLARSNGSRVHLDVLVYSPAGAAWWAGDDAVADYYDDPEASVFERIEIRADSLGRVA
jgi:hypothetical protein